MTIDKIFSILSGLTIYDKILIYNKENDTIFTKDDSCIELKCK